jgi:hypothetical protein
MDQQRRSGSNWHPQCARALFNDQGSSQHVTRRSTGSKIKEIDSHMAYLASSHNDAVWLSQLSRTRLTKYKENIRQLLIIPSSPLPHGAVLQLFAP